MSDSFFIIPVQVGMLVSLSQVFDAEITKAAAQSALLSYMSSTIGRNISQLVVGWIPGVGNAVNLATAVALTEFIGWNFVREYAENRKFDGRYNIFTSMNSFQDMIRNLSDDNYKRFVSDIRFSSGKITNEEREEAENEFFNIIAQYSIVYHIKTTEIVSEYTTYLKNILKKMETELVNGSRAYKYYEKLQKMEFNDASIDFDYLADFVEIFLELYNSMVAAYGDSGVSKFTFGIEAENPDKFFYFLYISNKKKRDEAILYFRKNGKMDFDNGNKRKDKIDSKKILKKRTIQALTSLLYCYAADREGEKV